MIINIDKDIVAQMKTNKGELVHDLSFERPVLLIFLRHFGCIFCQEALNDLSEMTSKFEHENVKLVMVHMSDYETADQYFEKFNLQNPSQVSDIELNFYTNFGLLKGNFSQLYGLSTWFRGFSLDSETYKVQLAKHLGDATQMPGIFALYNGEVKFSYIHKKASARPDYNSLLEQCKNWVTQN